MPSFSRVIVVDGLEDAWQRFRISQGPAPDVWGIVRFVRVPGFCDEPAAARLRVFAALPEPDRLRLSGEDLASFYHHDVDHNRFYFRIQDRRQVRSRSPRAAPPRAAALTMLRWPAAPPRRSRPTERASQPRGRAQPDRAAGARHGPHPLWPTAGSVADRAGTRLPFPPRPQHGPPPPGPERRTGRHGKQAAPASPLLPSPSAPGGLC